jgi:hypothetical protein
MLIGEPLLQNWRPMTRNWESKRALIELFRAKWSADIHEEWMSSLIKNRPDLTRVQLERTRYDDRHVLAEILST